MLKTRCVVLMVFQRKSISDHVIHSELYTHKGCNGICVVISVEINSFSLKGS